MATILDVTPANAGIRINRPEDVMSSIRNAIWWSGGQHRQDAQQRWDSAGEAVLTRRDGIDAYNRHVDGLAIREYMQGRGGALPPGLRAMMERRDAAGLPGGAGGFPRDFEHIRSEVWQEARQPLNAWRLFPRDTSVPLGAKKHTARRVVGNGEAEIYRGGSVQVRARTSQAEEQFGMVYVVSAVQTQFFELLTTDWAGVQQYKYDLDLSMRLVDEKTNEIAWHGDEASNVYGILTYPHLAKAVFPLTIANATDPKLLVRELHTAAETPRLKTGGTFAATKMATSPRIRNFLATRQHDETTGGTDTTMLKYFLGNQDPAGGIESVEVAQELQGIGPNGEDGILVYRPERRAMGLVDIQSTTTMPIYQSSALEQTTIVWSAFGGAVMGDVGNHVLFLAPTSGIG